MPYTMEQFRKEYVKAHLNELDLEDRIKGLNAEEVLSRFNPEERLKGLNPEEIEKYLKKFGRRKRH